MKIDLYTKMILTLIAALLAYNAFFGRPTSVQAQGGQYRFEKLRTRRDVGNGGFTDFVNNNGQIVGTCTVDCYLLLR